ncbi:MAG: hypothetical protein ACE5I1_29260 [bacterium]
MTLQQLKFADMMEEYALVAGWQEYGDGQMLVTLEPKFETSVTFKGNETEEQIIEKLENARRKFDE